MCTAVVGRPSAIIGRDPFDEHTGLLASELRATKQRTTWYDLAHEYIEQRWERTPGKTRRTLAGAFATVTPALVRPRRNVFRSAVTYPRAEPRVWSVTGPEALVRRGPVVGGIGS